MNESMFYRFLRPIVKILTNIIFQPKYEGKENIPDTGSIILAGNHTSILDPILLISSTKRSIHFLAKDELWKFPKSIIFANLGLIPVNRRQKDKTALKSAVNYLNEGSVIGIFPEGTTEKGRGLLSFKIGTVKMAYDTDAKIVPFAIVGQYGLFKRIKIKYGAPIVINNSDLTKENEKLRNIIKEMIKEG